MTRDTIHRLESDDSSSSADEEESGKAELDVGSIGSLRKKGSRSARSLETDVS